MKPIKAWAVLDDSGKHLAHGWDGLHGPVRLSAQIFRTRRDASAVAQRGTTSFGIVRVEIREIPKGGKA